LGPRGFQRTIERFVGGATRLSGLEDDGKPADGEPEEHFVFEIAYPPYAYVMSVDERTPAVKTVNITNFADLRIEQRAEHAEVMLLAHEPAWPAVAAAASGRPGRRARPAAA
jgi:hypothetical protein